MLDEDSLLFAGDKFVKKLIKLEKRNKNPDYFKNVILDNFPELLEFADEFSLWQMRMNTYEFVPLLDSINNARALCNCNELKRSCVYVRPCVSDMFSTGGGGGFYLLSLLLFP